MINSSLLKSSSKLAILSLATAALFGCGGSGDIVSSQPLPTTLTPPAPTSYSVSGTITGAKGDTDIVVNGETITLSVNSGFEFDDVVEPGGTVTISVPSDAFGQACGVVGDTTIQNVRRNVTGVVVECVDIPVINARVQNFFTGESIDTADVSLSRQLNGTTVKTSEALDDGIAAFEVPLSAGRLSIGTDIDGFSEQVIIVDTPDVAQTIIADIYVQTVDVSESFDNAAGTDVTIDENILASISNASFVDSAGAQIAGNVLVDVTVIDPSQSSELMPGDFLAQNPVTGAVSQLESFGALDVAFEDAAGNPVELAADKTITIRVPISERAAADAPDRVPLYFLDRDTGYWVQDGFADLVTLPSGDVVYEGEGTKSTTYTTGRPLETVQATGCVVDTDGQAVAGVSLQAEGSNYVGLSRALSDEDGVYTISLPENSSQFISAIRGSQSRTLVVNSGATNFRFANAADPDSCLIVRSNELGANSASMTLTWGEDPRDLDTYFYGAPTVETDTNVPFQVAYFNQEVTVNGQTIFLDVDDTTSFGPEILTIPSFPYEGVYTYGVDLFAGEGTIASSAARVQLNLGGSIGVYSTPEGEPTRCWAVMRFIVDAEGNVTRETIGTWEAREYCTSGPETAADSGAAKPIYGFIDPARLKSE